MTRNLRRFFFLPLLPFVAALVAGAAAGGMGRWPPAAAISLVFFSLLIAGIVKRWIRFSWAGGLAVGACFVVAFAAVYILVYPILPKNHVANFAGRKAWIIEGRVLPPLDPGLDHSQVTIGVRALLTHGQQRIPVCGKLRVSVYGPYTRTIYVGDTVRFVSAIARPRPPANPFSFDYRRFLALRRVYATARVNDFSRFVVLEKGDRVPLSGRIDRLRQRLNRWILASVPAPYNALASAFLIGYRGQVSPAMREIFIRCGAAHLIAISGLHLGIVSILLFVVIRRLLAFFPRVFLYMDVQRITAVLTFFCLLFYLVLTGGRVSTVRAFIMAAAFLAVLFFRRTSRLPDILLLAAFLILLFQPQAVFFASFQLTFAAVAGILLGVDRREFKTFEANEKGETGWMKKILLWLGATLLITVLAMAATFPIATYHFHRASPMALFANLFGIPYVALVMLPLGLISLIVYPFSVPLATVLLRIDGVLIEGLVRFFRLLAGFSWSRVYVPPLRWYEIVFYYGLFVFVVFALKSRNRSAKRRNVLLAAGCAAALIIALVIPRMLTRPSLTVFSVRRGVYLVARGEDGHAAIFCHGLGGSPRRDDARWVLLPYLLRARIRSVDTLVVANDTPVNLRAVAGLLSYASPKYILGTRNVLYGLRSSIPIGDTRITFVTPPRSLKTGDVTIRWPRRASSVWFRVAGLRVAVALSGRKSFIGEEARPEVLLATSTSKIQPFGMRKSGCFIRYPGMFSFYSRKGRAKAGIFDLRRDGAVMMEKNRSVWHLTTFLSQRRWTLSGNAAK